MQNMKKGIKRKGYRRTLALLLVMALVLMPLENVTGFSLNVSSVAEAEGTTNSQYPYFANEELIAFCRKNKIIVEARSPFAHGDVMEEWKNHPVLKRLAGRYMKTVPQIILRWIVQQRIIALPRSSNYSHLSENIDIFDFSLNEDDMYAVSALNRNLSFGCLSVRNQQ